MVRSVHPLSLDTNTIVGNATLGMNTQYKVSEREMGNPTLQTERSQATRPGCSDRTPGLVLFKARVEKEKDDIMGMFDYLKCKYPLPDAGANDLEYQTKDTPAQFLDHYEIRADGSLWHLAYDIEDKSDPHAEGFARWAGRISYVNERWEPVPFTGEIRFYHYANETRTEFSAYFVNGMLNLLTPIGEEPIPVKIRVKLGSGREAEVEPAKGIHGMLMASGAGDGYFLRVRHGTEFRDYRLLHSDLAVRIVDNDAFFYRVGDDLWLDHAPETLGLEIVNVAEGA